MGKRGTQHPYRLKPDNRTGPRKPVSYRYDKGPWCGAIYKNAAQQGKFRICKQGAGYKTNHPGQGRCYRHGGAVPMTAGGRYSKINHHRLRDLVNRIRNEETDVLDLADECHLLRALTFKYVEEYEVFVEALMEWYADPKVKQKPRRIMDISDASQLIESISRVAERYHRIQSSGAIDLLTFRRVTEQMGMIVANYVSDTEILGKISAEWGNLALDAKRRELPADPTEDQEEAHGEE